MVVCSTVFALSSIAAGMAAVVVVVVAVVVVPLSFRRPKF